MILVAFIAFAILVVAWLAAPNGEKAKAVAAAPVSLKMGDARA